MHRGIAALALSLCLAPLLGCGTSDVALHSTAHPVFADSFDGFADGVWEEGETHGGWTAVFDGYGEIGVDGGALMTSPLASVRPAETHAALVASTAEYERMQLEVVVTTTEQLRDGEPNPWETGWVLWSYTSNTSFYYVAVKTNGWEVGKADVRYPGYQRFLADGRDVTFDVGQPVDVRVRQVGATTALWLDGELMGSWVDREDPLPSGAVAMYTEDATVYFDDVVVSEVD